MESLQFACFLFFFQAEDGIRDHCVTGVQTCALPISHCKVPVEGFSVNPSTGTLQWAVSQAAPFRRMHVRGNMVLHQNSGFGSGGWMSDDLIDGDANSGPQQQWISRNTRWGTRTGANWNLAFVGGGAP